MVTGATVRLSVIAVLLTACSSPVQTPGATDVELDQLADGIWRHTSYHRFAGKPVPSHGIVVASGDSVALVDTAWGEGPTRALLKQVERQIGLPVDTAVITHFHDDRSGGIDVLQQHGVKVFMHPQTLQLLGAGAGREALRALSEAGASTTVGSLEILYPGHGHSVDNIVVWLDRERILFAGCLVRAAESATAGNIADADLDSWVAALIRLRQRYPDAAIVIPGHGRQGELALIDHTIRLVEAAERR